MTLSTRLWLWGAILPATILAAVLFAADTVFHAALERTLDQALLAQAAIESVSLFDGPKNEPHLHMASSPLVDSVRPFAPEGILFGPDGAEVMRYPPPLEGEPVDRLQPASVPSTPSLSTVEHEGHRHRELVVSVRSPAGTLFALKLSASLAQADASTKTFHLVALAATAATVLLLVVIQGVQGRGLRRRLAALRAQLEAVRAGELERRLEPDVGRDEVSEVHQVLGEATEKLQAVRDARERLLADAAHELRTPLSLMRTRLDLALRRERTPDELKTALAETRGEVVRLASLASRLLDTAAISRDAHAVESLDVAQLVDDALAVMRDSAGAQQVELVAKVTPGLTIRAHAIELRQVLDNLLSNALKYAPGGSAVTVSAAVVEGTFTLSVKDLGAGIPDAERENVFEPFHRVRGGPPGTGLGLAIVREVARRHGGRAFVASTTPGAEVVVCFPA